MKYLIGISLLLISATPLLAQRTIYEDGRLRVIRTGIAGETGSESEGGSLTKKNIIKLNLSSLAYKNIGVQYERALSSKISFALQGRYMLEGTIPGTSQLSDYSTDTINIFKNLKISSWAVTPEFRFYVKEALRGFYIAPYARIRNMSINFPINYTDDNNKAQTINTKGSFTTIGGGIMIGANFKIGNSISLDWFILGGHYSATNIDISSKTSQTLSASDQLEVNDFLASTKEPLSTFIKNYSYSVTGNELRIKGNMNSLGLRGAGINLGFRF
jgi:hypothetical protein